MTDTHVVLDALKRTFTDAISVRSVPSGLAINSPFYDNSGDHLAFYARDTDEGTVLEDDGSFLPHLIASGIDISSGQRRITLDTMLREAGAYWDPETFEIRTHGIAENNIGEASVRFLSGLLRIRALEFSTRENVRSTFKEDALAAVHEHLSGKFFITERDSLAPDLEEYPADIVLRPRHYPAKKSLGLFLVNGPTQFLEAELLHTEIERTQRQDWISAVALIEDLPKVTLIGEKRYQRAINRGLNTRFFRGDERQAITGLQKLAA